MFYLQSDEDLLVPSEQHIRKNMEYIIDKACCKKINIIIRDDFIGPPKELVQSATGKVPTSQEYALINDNITHLVCSNLSMFCFLD